MLEPSSIIVMKPSVTITVESNIQSYKGYIEVTSEPGSQFTGQLSIITASLLS